mmetsp:Transcript_22026/g.59408  ORF Transcript_22026/g.59408 Transcript_22026/m.59408 type:complete len:91 (+) Transcript_22026:587-859(+)
MCAVARTPGHRHEAGTPTILSCSPRRHREPRRLPAFTKTVLDFWKGRAEEMPSWAAAARIVFAMAPSSAACERVFSLLIPCSRSSSGVPP